MSCKYCDAKRPKDGQRGLGGSNPAGKPIFQYNHYPCRQVFIVHECDLPAIPDMDRWLLMFMENGVGTYIEIKYCPMCGHELGIEDSDA